jgi:integrase
MDNTPDSPAKTPVGYTTQGGNYWTLITPEIWKVLHAVLHKGKKGKARNGDDVRGFIVPLTDSVLKWFSDLKELAFQSDYVLPIRSRKKAVGDAHMEAVTLNAAFNKFWKTYVTDKCQRFTPHDLRSTARSHLSRLGVELLIAERCLNHSLGGLIAIYDQHDYLDERRIALEKLSEFLVSCESS